MLKQRLILCLLIMLISAQPTIGAQDYSAKLETVLEKIKTNLAEQKPEWKHRAIEPMKGSRNVSVNKWESDSRGVRISIIAYASENEAKAEMREFSSETRTLDRLPTLGDGGYSWGRGGSNIAFRKGDVTIWVSSSVTNLVEGVALSQEFASLIAASLATT